MSFYDRLLNRSDQMIQESIINPKKACLIEFDLGLDKNGNRKTHWVVPTGKIPGLNAYFIVDTYDGKRKTSFAYGNKIIGSAHFLKQTIFNS